MKRLPFLGALVGAMWAGVVWAAETPPEANRLRPDHLPTPFSAAQIREASPEGYTTRHVITAAGRPTVQSVNQFMAGDAETAQFRYFTASEDGEPLAEPQLGEATWLELQAHASFPAQRTTIERTTVEVPAGTFACWLYTVSGQAQVEGGEPKPVVSRFWFAHDLPGPPVKMEQSVDGALAMTMALVSAKVE